LEDANVLHPINQELKMQIKVSFFCRSMHVVNNDCLCVRSAPRKILNVKRSYDWYSETDVYFAMCLDCDWGEARKVRTEAEPTRIETTSEVVSIRCSRSPWSRQPRSIIRVMVVKLGWCRRKHTLGTIVAGSQTPGIQQVLSCIIDWGAKEESTVFVFGNKLPAPSAALMNATMAHWFSLILRDGTIYSERVEYPKGHARNQSGRKGNITGKTVVATKDIVY
jgi:hypothetical protein